MINLLIADDNLHYIKRIINTIISQTLNIRISNIATNGKEVVDILSKNKIDLVLLDLNMPIYSGVEILKMIQIMRLDKIPDIIVISGENELINEVKNNEYITDIAYKTDNVISIYKKIERISNEKNELEEIRNKIRKELLYLGYSISHQGTLDLIDSILYIYEHKESNLLSNIEDKVYKRIASKKGKKIKNIKSNIIKATNYMYINTKMDILKEYFGFIEDKKPNPKLIISAILNKL